MLSAAMAFYVLISIAPLLVIAAGLLGQLLDEASVRAHVLDLFATVMDTDTTDLIGEILDTPWISASDWLGVALAALTLVITSTAGFNHLRTSLNRIFESPSSDLGTVATVVRGRLLSFVVVLVFGLAILGSVVLQAVVSGFGRLLESSLPVDLSVIHGGRVLLLLLILIALFAFILRFLPDRKLPWRSLLVGASVTSVLFLLGELAIGAYLGRAEMASAFGVAGSTVVLALWVYYSAMVFFWGAELTCVFAEFQP
jgi:membrane protein